jgi:heme/copper-type cytochrome/quinol oxidase subunit 1
VPALTRWYLRAAMIHLGGALVLGVLVQVPAVVASHPVIAVLFPTLLHLLVVGWITQVIFGVAYWMFPRYSAQRPRGSERLGWITFGSLNVGVLLRVVGEPRHALGEATAGVLVASALLQLLAGWTFVLNTWPRIRER